MTNDFEQQTYWIFWDKGYSDCWYCGQNHADCGHHIFGRGVKGDDCEKSPLNFAPLNNHFCHLPFHGYLVSHEGRGKMFSKTINYLWAVGYKLDERDNRFLEKYKNEISKLNLNL